MPDEPEVEDEQAELEHVAKVTFQMLCLKNTFDGTAEKARILAQQSFVLAEEFRKVLHEKRDAV